jgi:two-component system OmpR family sensor kinase
MSSIVASLISNRRWYWPSSFRGRLLFWLVAVHLVAAAAVAQFAYLNIREMVMSAKDEQMTMLADSYTGNTHPPVLTPVDATGVIKRGSLVVQVWSAAGQLVGSSFPTLNIPLQQEPGMSDVRTTQPYAEEWRVFTASPIASADAVRVQIIQCGSYVESLMRHRMIVAAAPILFVMPLSLAVLWLVVTLSTRSLGSIAREVAAQDERSLSELSLVRVPDEIAPLVGAFNILLVRMREAFAVQRRFVQDAAHELRTPVAAIGLQIENLRTHVPAGEATERFANLEAGVTRAGHLIDQLLRLSRHESAAPVASLTSSTNLATTSTASPQPSANELARESVPVAELLRESLGQLMVLADRRSIDVGFEGDLNTVVHGSRSDLRSIFDNLIDNALRYSPVGGVVDVRLHRVAGRDVVDVVDQGPGIPAALRSRVFDRFFRVPGTSAGGSGLGLAIARTIAERNGMSIELLDREDAASGATGLVARVLLPMSAALQR